MNPGVRWLRKMRTLKGTLRQVELLWLGRTHVPFRRYCPTLRTSKGTSEMTKIRRTLAIISLACSDILVRTVLSKKSKPVEPSEAVEAVPSKGETSKGKDKGSKPKAKAKPKAKGNKRRGCKTD